MKIIGLCGGSGSGKGYVSSLFASLGIPSIDTDKVYNNLISYNSECVSEIASLFGDAVLNTDGSLSKSALRDIVFQKSNKDKLALLNTVTHKHILNATRKQLKAFETKGDFAAIVDAPLLFESGFDRECDYIIAVLADRETRISRVILRDAISREVAERRMDLQKSDEFLRENSDFVIYNTGDNRALENQIKQIYDKIRQEI